MSQTKVRNGAIISGKNKNVPSRLIVRSCKMPSLETHQYPSDFVTN